MHVLCNSVQPQDIIILFSFYLGAEDELTVDSMFNTHYTIEQHPPHNLEHSQIWDNSNTFSGSLVWGGTKNVLESQKQRCYFPVITKTNIGH